MIKSTDSTKTLLVHLAKAQKKIKYKHKLRRELTEHIKRLKTESSEPLKKRIVDLEASLHKTLEKENIILEHQEGEETSHKRIQSKVTNLDKKLEKYLSTAEGRKQRIAQLEDKVKKRFASRKEKVQDLRNDLKEFEKLYRKIKKTGKYKKQLEIIKKRIQKIKSLLNTLSKL